MLNRAAARDSEYQYTICKAIPVVQEIVRGEGMYPNEHKTLAALLEGETNADA